MLLTNDGTFSAGEVLSLVMATLPNVLVVGEHTAGCFSDQLGGKLSNGWTYTMSHQRYHNAAGQCYEKVGVQPDVAVVNSAGDLESGEDPVVIEALRILASDDPFKAKATDKGEA